MTAINSKNTRSAQRVNEDGIRVAIPKEMAQKAGINHGDILLFKLNDDNSLTIKKVE